MGLRAGVEPHHFIEVIPHVVTARFYGDSDDQPLPVLSWCTTETEVTLSATMCNL